MFHKTIIIFTFAYLLNSSFAAVAQETEGYILKDVNLGGYQLWQGEKFSCDKITNSQCCFETHEGQLCFSTNLLSKTKVDAADISIQNVKGFPSLNIDACKSSDINAIGSDHFIRSYTFVVNSSPQVKQKVFVELSISFSYRDINIDSLAITKSWYGVADNQCHSIIITKDDIDAFQARYRKLNQFLDIEIDENIYANLELNVFSRRKEKNYSNNVFRTGTSIPAYFINN